MTYSFIDAHVHLDDEQFDEDRAEIIQNFKRDGVRAVINASSDLASSKASVALTKHAGVYCVVGVHPHEAKSFVEEDIAWYKEALRQDKVLGIGECGLDYHYDFSDRPTQQKVFARMIELANEVDAPLVIHSREATQDTIAMLKDTRRDKNTLIHCFTGAVEVARDYLNLGFYLSIGGAVTFKNAKHVVESVAYMPLDRLLLETDAPYMTPVPYRGKRNEPKYIEYVIERIADIKNTTKEKVVEAANRNTEAMYRHTLGVE